MLGKQNRQTSFLDMESWFDDPIVDPDSIYGLMAKWGTQLIREEDFSELYSATGRPSVSPGLLAKVLLLMYHDNVSDREAEQREYSCDIRPRFLHHPGINPVTSGQRSCQIRPVFL